MKPNYSELGRIYGIDRRTAKKKYNGIENKVHMMILKNYLYMI